MLSQLQLLPLLRRCDRQPAAELHHVHNAGVLTCKKHAAEGHHIAHQLHMCSVGVLTCGVMSYVMLLPGVAAV